MTGSLLADLSPFRDYAFLKMSAGKHSDFLKNLNLKSIKIKEHMIDFRAAEQGLEPQ